MYREQTDGDAMGAAGGGFAVGLMWGVAIGAGLAFLFAPRAGAELREQMSDSINRFGRKAKDSYDRTSETLKDTYDRTSETVKDAYDRASEKAKSAYDQTSEATNDAMKAGRKTVDDMQGIPRT